MIVSVGILTQLQLRSELCFINLEERSYPAPPQINFSVCLSVCLSVCPSICPEYKKTQVFNVGIKIRVSTWSICLSSDPLKYLFLRAIMYCILSTEVKPKTISPHSQKADTMSKPEKSSSSHAQRAYLFLCLCVRGSLRAKRGIYSKIVFTRRNGSFSISVLRIIY